MWNRISLTFRIKSKIRPSVIINEKFPESVWTEKPVTVRIDLQKVAGPSRNRFIQDTGLFLPQEPMYPRQQRSL